MNKRQKVIGVGLNKTGTKTLRHCLQHWGYRHQSYDLAAFQLYRENDFESLWEWMERFDSFEDWPWPLFYQEIDQRFPDAKFVLTTRRTPDIWYRSLCKMAVRMGPLADFERHIYGYDMPQGRKREHLEIYERHNHTVQEYFAGRPDKLFSICWEDNDEGLGQLAAFLGEPSGDFVPPNLNQSLPVYGGDNLWLAQLNRLAFQSKWWLYRQVKRAKSLPRRVFRSRHQS